MNVSRRFRFIAWGLVSESRKTFDIPLRDPIEPRLQATVNLPTHRAMPRPILATVHTEALAHNLGRARAVSPDAKVWAVVKANAYGQASSAFSMPCAVLTALPYWTWPKPSACARSTGAGPSCCSKAVLMHATWSCAPAWACGTPFTLSLIHI